MTITYRYGHSLYVNITNRCPNRCEFCIRTKADGFYADNLWLESEPTREEILKDIARRDLSEFDSLVFCGYGEPTERLDDMLAVCREIKKTSSVPIRVNTNGLADLIAGRKTAPLFRGALDIVSISLNAADPAGYQAICRSRFGEAAFGAILSFAREVKEYVPSVLFTAVRGTVPEETLAACASIAGSLGIPLRIRDYINRK